jgi:UDP-glucose 4-epimerase
MLIHKNREMVHPKRVVIFGASGFVGNSILSDLKLLDISVVGLGSVEINLVDENCTSQMENILKNGDTVIFVSAIAPAKNIEAIISNLKMINNLKKALQKINFSHLIYVSSDAVYKDSDKMISESNCAEPNSEHGLMHLCREKLLLNFKDRLAIVRPTLIYGIKDPHNGYGPNQFVRKIISNEDIILFGKGEELRDHVSINTVSLIIRNILLWKSVGVINAVSGDGVTFKDIAEYMIYKLKSNSKIIETERVGGMPHNGYRLFNNKLLKASFKNLSILSWKEGIKLLCDEAIRKNG